MELSATARAATLVPRACTTDGSTPSDAAVSRRLLRHGVKPTPKILHNLRKKQAQKSLRKTKKNHSSSPPLTAAKQDALDHENRFRAAVKEYQYVKNELRLAGKPWDRSNFRHRACVLNEEEEVNGRVKGENLEELRVYFAQRKDERLNWLLDDDVEEVEDTDGTGVRARKLNMLGDDEKIRLLVERLSSRTIDKQDWRFTRLLKQSELYFMEGNLIKILEGLGDHGSWRQAMSVVEWVYNEKRYRYTKSRFVYTKLLAVLGKARRPQEALHVFHMMREDGQIYPDMPAYHAIAVTLGQAGFVEELINIIELMRQKPQKTIKNMKRKNWDPCLEPDVIIYNAVINACVPSHQWKGVSWVLQQMRLSGLQPTAATYGLAMEVMLEAEKYELVHKFFDKIQRCGFAPKALTYKVLVKTLWAEGKIDDAVKAVREMEKRGIVGTASVYYELACCLCNKGRWQDSMLEVERLKRLPLTRPLAVTFTGMILSSLDGGHVCDCVSIFEQMKDHCAPNTGTINVMLKVYGRIDMFGKAKELFESTLDTSSSRALNPDAYTYTSMLEVSASLHQWEFFEYVYKKMAVHGYQLDQKNAYLLVEASKSGKSHLLEHAFEITLEAGEVPHSSLFMELICQSIIQQNFDRTVRLLNGMAHGTIQVNENQWRNFFRRKKGRFCDDDLKSLQKYIDTSDLVREEPSLSFLSILNSLFQSTISCGESADNSVLTKDETADVGPRGNLANGCKLWGDPKDSSEDSGTDKILNMLTAHITSSSSQSPSAVEILERWKEDRVKEGRFPFQYS